MVVNTAKQLKKIKYIKKAYNGSKYIVVHERKRNN